MIVADNLSKSYNNRKVLSVPRLEIPPGQLFGLVGNNGAGKTTFFNLLLDLIPPSSGHVTNKGIRVDLQEDWKGHTAAFLDESFLIGYLSPEEYFYFIGSLRGMNQADVDRALEVFRDFFKDEVLGQRKYLRDLSRGNQKKAGIAAAFLGDPEVVVLDEPFANLDPSTQIRLKSYLSALAGTGTRTILISSHDLLHLTEVCDRIVLLHEGEMLRDLKTSGDTLKELENFFSG